MNVFLQRIMQIVDYYGFKNINNFATKGLKWKSAEKIHRLKNENNKPSIDILIEISNKFDKINANWLLTGKGQMLKELDSNSVNFINTPNSINNNSGNVKLPHTNYKDIIEVLKQQLSEKDKQLTEREKQFTEREKQYQQQLADLNQERISLTNRLIEALEKSSNK